MKASLILPLLLLALLVPCDAGATNWYCSSYGTLSAASSTAWSGANLVVSCSSLQTTLTASHSGDTIYAAGTFPFTTYCNVNTNGAITAPIRIVGCNATTGSADGTYAVVQASGAGVTYLLNISGVYYRWENMERPVWSSSGRHSASQAVWSSRKLLVHVKTSYVQLGLSLDRELSSCHSA